MESMSGGYYCHIEITDNGCGIPENKFEEIFDPFFTTKEGKGTGLGLAVVWGIIEEHKGMISVKSELNKGSTFTIQLPIKT
jgi:signal transduction histidine kinase